MKPEYEDVLGKLGNLSDHLQGKFTSEVRPTLVVTPHRQSFMRWCVEHYISSSKDAAQKKVLWVSRDDARKLMAFERDSCDIVLEFDWQSVGEDTLHWLCVRFPNFMYPTG